MALSEWEQHFDEALKAERAKREAQAKRDRRERIATAVLAGRVAYRGFGSDGDWANIATLAVGLADSLIAALDAEDDGVAR